MISGNQFDNFTQAVDFAVSGNSAVTFTNNNMNNVTSVFSNTTNVTTSGFVFNPNFPMLTSVVGVASIGANGFSYDHNGLLTVRGTSTVTVGTPLAVTFLKAFVSAPRIATSLNTAPSTNNTVDLTSITNTGFTINLRGGAGSGAVQWIAQGV